MEKTVDMTKGNIFKQMLIVSIPLIFSNVLQVLFNISDIAVVGKFSGPIALGSVGSTTTFVNLSTGLLWGISCGINVLVARFFAQKNERDVSETVSSAFVVSLLFGIAVLLFGLFLSKPILTLLKTKEDLIDGANVYVKIYFLGMPFLAVYNFGNAVFSAIGDTKKPLVFLILSGVINIILNLFFVLVLKIDVAGVAIASVISQALAATLVVISLTKVKGIYKLDFKNFKISSTKSKMIISLGLPAGVQNAIFQIANLFIQSGINTFDSTTVEGATATFNADALVYDAMASFYTACSSFLSQNYGVGNKKRVMQSYVVGLLYSFAIGLIMGLLLVLFGMQFLSLFTSDKLVATAGMRRLKIMGYSYCVSAFMDCTIAASRGLGKTTVPTIIVIMGSCVFRIIWVYTIFAYFKTIESLFLLYVFSWSITAIAEIIYFLYIYKKQTKNL